MEATQQPNGSSETKTPPCLLTSTAFNPVHDKKGKPLCFSFPPPKPRKVPLSELEVLSNDNKPVQDKREQNSTFLAIDEPTDYDQYNRVTVSNAQFVCSDKICATLSRTVTRTCRGMVMSCGCEICTGTVLSYDCDIYGCWHAIVDFPTYGQFNLPLTCVAKYNPVMWTLEATDGNAMEFVYKPF